MRFMDLTEPLQTALNHWYFTRTGMEGFRNESEAVYTTLEKAAEGEDNPIASAILRFIERADDEDEVRYVLGQFGQTLVDVVAHNPEEESRVTQEQPVRAVTWGNEDKSFQVIEQQERVEYVAVGLMNPMGYYNLMILVGTDTVTTTITAASGKPGIERLALAAVSQRRDGAE